MAGAYSTILRRFAVSTLLLLLELMLFCGGATRSLAAPPPLPRAQAVPSEGGPRAAPAAALAPNNWTRVLPVAPPTGADPLIYDPDTQTTFILDVSFGQIWSWNGSAWSLQKMSNLPGGFGPMAYDPSTHTILMLVALPGPNGSVYQTWTFSGNTWTRQPTTTTPPPGPLAHVGTQLVSYTNFNSKNAPATFSWDGTNWTEHDLPNQTGPQTYESTMADDGNGFLLYGSCCDINQQSFDSTWTLNPSTGLWTPICGTAFTGATGACGPGVRGNMSLASTPTGVLLFGGTAGINSIDPRLGDTWIWNGSWSKLCTQALCSANTPAPREVAPIAYDALHGQVVLFSGLGNPGETADTWLWNGSTWTQPASASPNPPVRSGAGFASTGSQLVLFGGASTAGLSAFDNVLGDTWLWNGSAWAQQCTSAPCSTNLPPARAGASMAYDGRQVVLFGGSICGDTCTLFNDTWVWDGTQWTAVCGVTGTPVCGPPARVFASLAFDSAHQQLVLFGGCSSESLVSGADECSGNPLGDTWIWQNKSWAQACTTTACKASLPPARSDASMTFDGRQIVVFGGCSGADGGACVPDSELGDTWTWSGSAWAQQCTAPSCSGSTPPATAGASLAYDGQEAVLYDPGIPEGSSVPSTWVWNGAVGSWTELCKRGGTPECGPASCTLFGPPQCLFPRAGAAMAYDAAADTVFLYSGGQTLPSGGLDDIWAWQAGPLVSASKSTAAPSFVAAPDNGFVITFVVTVKDTNSNPLQGQTVSLGQGSGTHAVITAPGGTTSNSQGQVSFAITDGSAEPVTFTPAAGGVQLQAQPLVTFELQGDVNLDGSVAATDALCVLRDVAKLTATPACQETAASLSAADVNRDPTDDAAGFDSTDALCVLRIVAHLGQTTACPLFDGGRTFSADRLAPNPQPRSEREGGISTIPSASSRPSIVVSPFPLGKGGGG